MKKYVAKRLLQLIPIIFGITLLSFAMMRLAGSDAITQMYNNTGTVVSEDIIEQARARLGLDKPFIVQYFLWLGGMLRGDMGVSYVTSKPVFSTFVSKLPSTLFLTLTSVIFTIAVAVPLGIWSAVKQNKVTDYIIRVCTFVGNSLPNFFVALLLLELFAIKLKVLPVLSTGTDFTSVIMPTLTLGISMASKYTRQVRAAVLDELSKEYVVGAQARGVRGKVILWGSVLRSSLLTIVTLLAMSVGSLLGGTAIVESIFMWDGVGKLAVDSITVRDYPIIQAYVVWMAIIFVVINLVTDLLYHRLDPRIRLGGDRK
ncbi:MAG: ABC transporter permease [Clostridiales bacterium]|nr:ABC transporter permease [Clostridiales bacterium]MBS5877575.1 ABC transporter permease [Clostridiales bacterium]MDU0939777.1 ABC transporter permease [Clostridiales bacterium]MDU1042073.1 ABC transporter permease [Clostridiales bacterium]MDU3490472.1 ABC transporter permease [Clostridiales bacterium]